jgi:uncharacterized protein (DUF983 family)
MTNLENTAHQDPKIRPAFTAFIEGRCPQCRQGKMFIHKAYSKKFKEMNENCQVCGLHFEIEPGFFWGSMYISYAFTVGIGLFVGILLYHIMNDPAVWVYLSILLGIYVAISPVNFRFGRIIMIWVFSPIKYNTKYNLK